MKKRCDPKRSAACRKAWATRRAKAAALAEARSRAAKRGWKTRRAKAERKARESKKRAQRAKKGHKTRKAKPMPQPKAIWFPAVSVKRESVPEIQRAPEILTDEMLEAVIADFARRRIPPELWARDLAHEYDLEEAPIWRAYFDIVSPR